MEGCSGPFSTGIGFTARRKRSKISRRPCSDTQKFSQTYTLLPLSRQCLGSGCYEEDSYLMEKTGGSDGIGNEKTLKKLKLKLGGVTHTIHTKPAADYAFHGGSSGHSSAPQARDKLLLQDKKDNTLRGKTSERFSANETFNNEPVRKSKRVPKRRIMDVGFDEDDDVDEEISYLGRLNASRVSADYEDVKNGRSVTKLRFLKVSDGRQIDGQMYNSGENYGPSKLGRDDRKKSRSEKFYGNTDYMEAISDDELGYRIKKLEFVDGRNESTPTTRNRAIQSAKDVSLGSGASLIEFPNGLPSPPKKKAKLSEVEQQLKRTEAAQRRRMQSEKAAREAEAEAIRKILGQDSGRKKKEEKMKKQHDESAQGKAGNANSLGPNTIRCVVGPTGTLVIFSEDIGLPSIFNSAPLSYPPPREKCAGPNCTNAYKYRDSKLKLPLCSLQCYKAIK